jgi:DNA-binding CsgD family transcriptional regulator
MLEGGAMDGRPPDGPADLTPRQLEVAKLVAEGHTNGEIADELGISLDGAKYHVSQLLLRLNLGRREQIGQWYRERGRRLGRLPTWLTLGRAVGAGALGATTALLVAAIVILSRDGPGPAPPHTGNAGVIDAVVRDGGVLHIREERFVLPQEAIDRSPLASRSIPQGNTTEDRWLLIDENGVQLEEVTLLRDEAGAILLRQWTSRDAGTLLDEPPFHSLTNWLTPPDWSEPLAERLAFLEAGLSAAIAADDRASIEHSGREGTSLLVVRTARGDDRGSIPDIAGVDAVESVEETEYTDEGRFLVRHRSSVVDAGGNRTLVGEVSRDPFVLLPEGDWRQVIALAFPEGGFPPAAAPPLRGERPRLSGIWSSGSSGTHSDSGGHESATCGEDDVVLAGGYEITASAPWDFEVLQNERRPDGRGWQVSVVRPGGTEPFELEVSAICLKRDAWLGLAPDGVLGRGHVPVQFAPELLAATPFGDRIATRDLLEFEVTCSREGIALEAAIEVVGPAAGEVFVTRSRPVGRQAWGITAMPVTGAPADFGVRGEVLCLEG